MEPSKPLQSLGPPGGSLTWLGCSYSPKKSAKSAQKLIAGRPTAAVCQSESCIPGYAWPKGSKNRFPDILTQYLPVYETTDMTQQKVASLRPAQGYAEDTLSKG